LMTLPTSNTDAILRISNSPVSGSTSTTMPWAPYVQSRAGRVWLIGRRNVTDTGEYDLLKIASVFDVGKVINSAIVRGQAIGGMIQGLGTAVCEGYIYDEQGHLLNPSFTDNKIPTAKDLPLEIESIAVETPQLDGPFGARGVGEHPMISVAPALGNAIGEATGVEILHMPIRAEDVWRAMRSRQPIDNWITKTPVGSCRSKLPEREPAAVS